MTGYGRASRRGRGFDVEVEARSVNHRFLSLKVGLPEALSRFEGDIDRLVRSRMSRGSVNISVTLKNLSATGPEPDLDRVKDLYSRLEKVRKKLGVKAETSLASLLSIPAMWTSDNTSNGQAGHAWEIAKPIVEKAIEDLEKARAGEGAEIRKDILARLDAIETAAAEIRGRAPGVLESYQRKLEERIRVLTEARGLQLAQTDLIKEIALYADKCDISEELQRLTAHVESFRKLVKVEGPIGRRLDFLTQEMVRETNTMASKGSDAAISSAAVLVKSELEKIKEQAENVE